MDWQQWVSLGVVAGTATLLIGSKLRRRSRVFDPNHPFGCAAAAMQGARQDRVIYRARKGERPEIIIKMK